MNQKRTYCKYGDCHLEKMEYELRILNQIWSELEENWASPNDYEDLYRIYPLLDTVAVLARKRLNHFDANRQKYKVEIIEPSDTKEVNTSKYLYSDEHSFFNGRKKECLLANITSTFVHGSEYKYMDTRKETHDKGNYEIYVFIATDILCGSCADANLDKPKPDKPNYKKKGSFVRYTDCTCGKYINVRSYIDAISELVEDEIRTRQRKYN